VSGSEQNQVYALPSHAVIAAELAISEIPSDGIDRMKSRKCYPHMWA
jgi:hypothetical protein